MIRQLRAQDAEAYAKLRREAVLDSPLSFASSPEDDVTATASAARDQVSRGPESVIFGAFEPGLVGMAGVQRDRHLKLAHKAHIWGMFVAAGHRERGLGADLLDAAIRHASALSGIEWIHIGVSSTAPAAHRLYERAGFKVWGTEADALRYEGEVATEYHMAMPVGKSGPSLAVVRSTE